MDMFWHSIETAPASYNFGEYDVLVKSMVSRGIRIVFILDYGNPLYDNGYPPTVRRQKPLRPGLPQRQRAAIVTTV